MVFAQRPERDARVGNDNIGNAMPRDEIFCCGLDRFAPGHIQRIAGDCRRAGLFQGIGLRIQQLAAPRHQSQYRALCGVMPGQCMTDAR